MYYTKMHGAGNSFVLVENRRGELSGIDPGRLALLLCNQKKGPGADGLIIIGNTDSETADFSMIFYNSDGTLGEMCGNGARCAARYGVEHGLSKDEKDIRFLATAGLIYGRRITDTLYEVRLNDPSVIDLDHEADALGERVLCSYIELGNPGIPHAVVQTPVSAFEDLDVLREKGRALRWSAAFPKGANITFYNITGKHTARAITFERGVEDFTLACGTGCGATAITLLLKGLISDNPVEIDMPGGRLSIRAEIKDSTVSDIFLTGPTAFVSEGEISL